MEVQGDTVYDQLNSVQEQLQIWDHFENQRRNIGKAYGSGNAIRQFSKNGIAALQEGDETAAQECLTGMTTAWEDLIRLDLPSDIAWQHQAEAGQEMVEFAVVYALYPLIRTETTVSEFKIPTPESLAVTEQTWLAGVGDAVGELGKMTDDLLCTENLTKEERKSLRQRFLRIATDIYDFLHGYETAYAQVINNSRRRGYGNTFRGFLGRVRGAINRQKQSLIEQYDRDADRKAETVPV